MKTLYIIAGLLLLCLACKEIEDATPMERNTFARFYEGSTSREGVFAQAVDGGYIILGNTTTSTDTTGLIIRTDTKGNIVWNTSLSGIIIRAMAEGPNGYYILGDSIKINPESEQLADLIIHSTLLYSVNTSGSVTNKLTITDTDTINHFDFKANALTFNNQNNLLVLGTLVAPTSLATERPFLAAFNPQNFDTLWAKTYDIIDRDYVNSKSVHATADGHVIWASAILKEQQSFSRSYLSIPYIKEESVFENSDVFGATTDQKLLAADIQPSGISGLGYGVAGTYASPNGEGSNVFFARVNPDGNFINGSERFFDGQLSIGNQSVSQGESLSEDTGNSLCSTSDGSFVLAATMVTTPERGNGGKDILLIKVDAQGNMIWNKLMGGSGDEVVSSIRETSDGGLLLCGSKDAAGLPAIFLIKTDSEGNIED